MENKNLIYALLEDGKVVDYQLKKLVDAQVGAIGKLNVKAESQGKVIIETDFENPLVIEFCHTKLQKDLKVEKEEHPKLTDMQKALLCLVVILVMIALDFFTTNPRILNPLP